MRRILLLAIPALTLTSSTACAGAFYESRDDRRYEHRERRRDRYENAFEIGLRNGYREGVREARRDEGRRYPASFRRNSEYVRADLGFRWEYGSRREYERAFREGFERGYYEERVREWRDLRRWPEHRHPGDDRWCRARH